MVQLDSIAKRYGERTLFDGVSWQLGPGHRAGLVGPNGAGKSTLLRIIAGESAPDEGRVIMPRDFTIGVLPQDVGELGYDPIIDCVLAGKPQLAIIEAEIARLEAELAEAGEQEQQIELAEQLARAHDRWGEEGGYNAKAQAAAILSGLGFSTDSLGRSAATFSGGWRMRVVLGRILFQRPDLLLLDEPTNHLDLPSIQWLEGFLRIYPGALILISHDRAFLNAVVTEIAAIEPWGFRIYTGNYDRFITLRDRELEALEAQKARQDREIADTERFIERFRAKATKARQVQSRVKALEKIERIELVSDSKSVHFQFPEAERSGKWVIEAEKLAVGWGAEPVLKDVDLVVERGERIALVGPNGAGKTTLLRALAGVHPVAAGSLRHGHNVETSYFAQHSTESLKMGSTVIEEMEKAATTDTFPLCRSILGAFLFSGDDIHKPISILSGGERNRVALARMLLTASNLLLLDEPTNHLDMQSVEVLQEAISRFGGTVIVVSHDRYFLQGFASRVLYVESGSVTNYPGDISYYLYKREQEIEEEVKPEAAAEPAQESRRDRKRREAEIRRSFQAERRALQNQVDGLEATIERLELECSELEALLADPVFYSERAAEAGEKQRAYSEKQSELEASMEAWEEAAAALEHLEEELEAALNGPSGDK